MEITTILGLTDVGCGILYMLICMPLIRRMVPMNHFYGFRIPKAFRSKEDWYAINEFGGRALFWWSFGLIATGVAKMIYPLDEIVGEFIGWTVVVGPIITFTLIPIVQTLVYAWQR